MPTRDEETGPHRRDPSDTAATVTRGASATRTSGVDAAAEAPAYVGQIGRFIVLRQLGAGGMGVVYLAYDNALDRKVAVKVIRGLSPDPERALRLQREARAMAKVSHPNVLQVFEVGEHGGALFLAMEYVRGGSLREWLERQGREDMSPGASGAAEGWRPIVELFRQAGRGLAAAHAAGLVHRDFKPKSRSPRPERPQLADRLQSPEFGRSGRGAAGSSRLWVPRDASDLGKPRAKPRSTPGGIKARSTMGRTLGQRRETCSTPGGIKARSTPTRRPR